MPVVGQVLVEDGHLTAANACTDVAHAVVIANFLVQIIRHGLTGLGCVEHDLLLGHLIRADERATSTGGDHLVAIEAHDAVFAKRATQLTTIP